MAILSSLPLGLSAFPNFFNDAFSLLSVEQLKQFQELQNDPKYLSEFPADLYIPREIPDRGIFFYDQIDDGVKILIREGGAWEPVHNRTIAAYIVPNTITIDIGAHVGMHTITMSKAVKNGVVLAFEPQKKICRELEMNVLINECSNVIPIHCALGDENRMAYLGAPVEGNEAARFISNYVNYEPVEMRTLDSFHLDHVSFIKIDTENFEQEVLKGAKETIMRNRPTMLIEIQGNNIKATEDGSNMEIKIQESIQILQNMGYHVYPFVCFDYLAIP